ncbi:MAG: glycoside hydrolase family 3 C-terminal domain-containing protein [Labilibaculum sp.]|nr:glycoside hydrolase family 3 C-terminal domain-containing protein [Labilibaculum sp.]MBI9058510.1 glycoside hydrolase family 3 C-terminal domain-containing protein [Labilibaculum sp.]
MANKKIISSLLVLLTSILMLNAQVWKDPNAPVDERVKDLLSKMTLEEKMSQCSSDIPAIERLGIPSYMWYGEALHGIIGWGATSFPQNIAMGATWNPELMHEVATAISNEARALKNMGKKEVMMFSPTVNMARDPRWGRNGECYSEDPFLMTEMVRMYVRGMQGNDDKYLKTVTTVKHFVANNVEFRRENIYSNISEKDLREYYFPAYKSMVTDEEAAGIMTALNGLNGVPCSTNKWLLQDVLRDEWGFKGYVIADWGDIGGHKDYKKLVDSYEIAASMAIKASCDQECFRPNASKMVKGLKGAIEQGLITEKELDIAVARLLRLRFMTGDFDDKKLSPWANIPESVLECDAHKKLARKAAEQSMVLLKNDGVLPLKKDYKSIAVVGPFADHCWLGIYSGHPQSKVSPLDGIRAATNAKIVYKEGCAIADANDDRSKFREAVIAAKEAELAIVVMGNDEGTSTENVDRQSLALPGIQQRLIEEIYRVNKNVVVVLVPSGPTAIPWAQEHIPGIVCMWPNGQEQGTALANVLFGKVNPGGKLNSTWYTSHEDLPDMHDYNIKNNRTYMYFKGKPLYPFGYGLSYTNFEMANLQLDKTALNSGQRMKVSVDVNNTGAHDGDEVVQLYIKDLSSKTKVPQKALKAFKRVNVKAGETKKVMLDVPYEAFAYYDTINAQFEVYKGKFDILVGNSSENISLSKTIKVGSGALTPVNIENKSAWFDANDPLRAKKWDAIYADKSFLKAEKTEEKKAEGLIFKTTFTDPGFYVNTWDAVVNYEVKSREAIFKLSILGNNIDTYKLNKSDVKAKGKLKIKIPIPPEYGVEQNINAQILEGEVELKSITIYPPGGSKEYTVYPSK